MSNRLQKLLYRLIGKELLKEGDDQEKVQVTNKKSGKTYDVTKKWYKDHKELYVGKNKNNQLPNEKPAKKVYNVDLNKIENKRNTINNDGQEEITNRNKDGSVEIKSNKSEKRPEQNVISLNQQKLKETVSNRYQDEFQTREQQIEVIRQVLLKIDGSTFNQNYNLGEDANLSEQEINAIKSNPNTKKLYETIQTVMSIHLPSLQGKRIPGFLQRLKTSGLKLRDVGNLKKVGQGELPAQIGQMMVCLFTHLPPNITKKLYKTMSQHAISQKGTQKTGWVQSTYQSSSIARQFVEKTLGQNYQIVNFGGLMQDKDVNEDMIGVKDTKADIFMFVRNKQTNKISAIPISLKKDKSQRSASTTATNVLQNFKQFKKKFNNSTFKHQRKLIRDKYINCPTLSQKDNAHIATFCQMMKEGKIDETKIFKKGTKIVESGFEQLMLIYEATKDMTNQERKKWLMAGQHGYGNIKKIIGKEKFSRRLEKMYIKAMYALSDSDQMARQIYTELDGHTRDYSNDLMKDLIKNPEPLFDLVKNNLPVKQMYQQGLIQISNNQLITWDVLLKKFNIKSVDQFVHKLRFQQGGNGYMKAVYSFKTEKGEQKFYDLFNIQVRQDGIGYSEIKFYIIPTPEFAKTVSGQLEVENLSKMVYYLING